MDSFAEEWQQIMDTPVATYKQYTAQELAKYFNISYKNMLKKLNILGLKPTKNEGRQRFYSEEVLQMPELKALKHKKDKEKKQKEQQIHVFETQVSKEIKTLNVKLDALAQENAVLEQKVDVLEADLFEIRKVVKLLSKRIPSNK